MCSAFNIHSIPSFTVLSIIVLNIFANATPTKPLLSAGDVTTADHRPYRYVPVAVEQKTSELVPALFSGALPSMNFDGGMADERLHHQHNHNTAVQQPSSPLYLLRSPSARNLFRATDESGPFSLVRAYDPQRNEAILGAERPAALSFMFPAAPTTASFAGLPSSSESNYGSHVNHVFDRLDYFNINGNLTTNTSPSNYYSTTNSTLTSPGSTSGDQFSTSYLQSLLSPPPPPPLPSQTQQKVEYGCPFNTTTGLILPEDVSRIVNSVWERSASRKTSDVFSASISNTSGSSAAYGTPSASNLRRISSCSNKDFITNMSSTPCLNDSVGLFKSPSTPRRNVSAKNLTTGFFNNPLVNNYRNNKSRTEDKSSSFSIGKWNDVYSSTESLSYLSAKSSEGSPSPLFKQPPLLFGDDSKPLTLFFTKVYCFSNHFPCERLVIDGRNFCCTEQYYMYYKARIFGDMEAANSIMVTTDPKQMKRIGTTVKNFNLKQWHAVSVLVMVIASIAKYEQNPDLRRQLFETAETTLVEASPSDDRWGVGLPIDSELIRRRKHWPGKNMMGYLLTKLRDRLLLRPEFAAERRAVYTANDVQA